MTLAERAAAASLALVALLDESQVRSAVLPFEDEERRTWAYWPTQRRGISFGALNRDQSKAAHRLLSEVLPLATHARVITIMGLDEVLDRVEAYSSNRRHAGDYWLTIFGRPGQDLWGLRVEGHHLSIHLTICYGAVRLTPLFLGANPATVLDNGHAILAPLRPEEELGFELLSAMSREQRLSAVTSTVAPDDILTGNQPIVDRMPPSEGVPLSALTSAAAFAARELVELYLRRFPTDALRPDPREATFVWRGAEEPGFGHYYRIAGPRLLIEFDNTQNGANHIHTVVRDPQADFGHDALGNHYQHAHGAASPRC